MSENAKQWELLHKHIKRCIKQQTEVLASIRNFRRPYVFIFSNKLKLYDVSNILIIIPEKLHTIYI